MVELVILACLLKNPQQCDTFHIPFAPEMNLSQCVWRSTVHAAEWVAEHPSWQIRKLRCAEPET
jgi:hypothetical protein